MTGKTDRRLQSLDALRGFDMIWITGGDALIKALAFATGLPFFHKVAVHMDHAEWEGFRFFDLIFPLFLFIAGCTIPFSILKKRKTGYQDKKIYRHLFARLLILIFLGMIYNGLLQFDFENMRYASVLARIGLGWFFAAIIALHFNIKGQTVWCISILLFYWAVMTLIPVPGYGAGVLTLEGNLSGYIDRLFLPGKFYFETMDPEGILSTFPAISTALFGTITGEFLLFSHKKLTGFRKGMIILASGIIFLFAGKIWAMFFPMIKNLWTSSFAIYAAGWSLILLAVFYIIIDVWNIKRWAFFFIVFGLNSITIYMLNSGIIDFGRISEFFFGGLSGISESLWQPVIYSAGYVLSAFLVLYFLYRYKIFLKI